jgi:hypothetical protein
MTDVLDRTALQGPTGRMAGPAERRAAAVLADHDVTYVPDFLLDAACCLTSNPPGTLIRCLT